MNHGMRLSTFKEFSRLKLLAIADTRFASVVVMLKRFCMVKKALEQMVIYGLPTRMANRGKLNLWGKKYSIQFGGDMWSTLLHLLHQSMKCYEWQTLTHHVYIWFMRCGIHWSRMWRKQYASMKGFMLVRSPPFTLLFTAYWLIVGLKAKLHSIVWHIQLIQGELCSPTTLQVYKYLVASSKALVLMLVSLFVDTVVSSGSH